jgi:hypothetical protein
VGEGGEAGSASTVAQVSSPAAEIAHALPQRAGLLTHKHSLAPSASEARLDGPVRGARRSRQSRCFIAVISLYIVVGKNCGAMSP